MIYYVGSVFVVWENGTRLPPVIWRFQVESVDAFKTMAIGTAIDAYGPGTQVEFGTIGVSRQFTHK